MHRAADGQRLAFAARQRADQLFAVDDAADAELAQAFQCNARGFVEVEAAEQAAALLRFGGDGSLAHRIAGDIIRGGLAPGSLRPREESAKESYGMSRSAYRETIRTLAVKGMVSPSPRGGTKVAPRAAWHVLDPDILAWRLEFAPDETFIRDLFELRKIVEPSAAALAALRRSEAALGRLADALSRLARANPRSGAWLNAIVAFHQELLSAGRNEALASLWPAVQTTLRWSVKLQIMLPTLSLAHDPVADHARVFEKVASQNAEGALTEIALLIDPPSTTRWST
jgi:DNA-binding FadR family transcriptional regulator